MAVKKTNSRKSKKPGQKGGVKTRGAGRQARVSASVLFTVFLFIALITIFFAILPKVTKGIKLPVNQAAAGEQQELPQEPKLPAPQEPATPPAKPTPTPPKPPVEKPPVEKPPVEKPPKPASEKPAAAETKPQPEKPPAKPPAASEPARPATPPSVPEKPPAQPQAAETRDRVVFFMHDRGGGSELILAKANRKLKVSDTPLIDSINALLAGTTADERSRNLASFIPADSKIISAQVRGGTAYLDFNEEFRYNTFGREGSIAQLQQIVWTATEFPNVNNVQILIDGKRVDFLSEGIPIGNPLSR